MLPSAEENPDMTLSYSLPSFISETNLVLTVLKMGVTLRAQLCFHFFFKQMQAPKHVVFSSHNNQNHRLVSKKKILSQINPQTFFNTVNQIIRSTLQSSLQES